VTVSVYKFEDDRGEFPVVSLIPGPINNTNVMVVRDYFNDFGPYGSFSKVTPLIVYVFEPNGTCYTQCNTLRIIIIIILGACTSNSMGSSEIWDKYHECCI